jgi:hypothetical protein
MGVDAPISTDAARIALAIESAHRALDGQRNVFDEATYVRVHLCELSDPPEDLRRLVNRSNEAKKAPRSQWSRIEADLKSAFLDFLIRQGSQIPG